MENWKRLAGVAVLLAIVAAAVSVTGAVPPGLQGSDAPGETSTTPTTPGKRVLLTIEPQQFVDNESGHYIRATVELRARGVELSGLSNVVVCAYDGEGTVLDETVLDWVDAGGPGRTVTVETADRPVYFLADHPRLHAGRESEYGVAIVWIRQPSGVYDYGPTDRIGFDYPRGNETGQCL